MARGAGRPAIDGIAAKPIDVRFYQQTQSIADQAAELHHNSKRRTALRQFAAVGGLTYELLGPQEYEAFLARYNAFLRGEVSRAELIREFATSMAEQLGQDDIANELSSSAA